MFIEKQDYDAINRSFPLNAVELIILNRDDKILMVKRANEPAKGQWWIPGGRVLFAETRLDAARRLLQQECGVVSREFKEVEMFEYAVKNNITGHYQHTISSVYQVKIDRDEIKMDSQSSDYAWKYPSEWEALAEHNFIRQLLRKSKQDEPASFAMDESASPSKTKFIDERLYSVILKALSVPCVDLLIKNKAGEILLVKRKNAPVKGQWWVPGGRVWHGEKRIDTAKRKLFEECGLRDGKDFKKVGNFEFIFNEAENTTYHDIATLYEVSVDSENVVLDTQSSEFCWKSPAAWLELPLDDFIKTVL